MRGRQRASNAAAAATPQSNGKAAEGKSEIVEVLRSHHTPTFEPTPKNTLRPVVYDSSGCVVQ